LDARITQSETERERGREREREREKPACTNSRVQALGKESFQGIVKAKLDKDEARERERERERGANKEGKREGGLAIGQMRCNLHLDYEIGSQLGRLVCVHKGIYRRPISKVTIEARAEAVRCRKEVLRQKYTYSPSFYFGGKETRKLDLAAIYRARKRSAPSNSRQS